MRPIAHEFCNAPTVVGADEEAARPLENVPEPLGASPTVGV